MKSDPWSKQRERPLYEVGEVMDVRAWWTKPEGETVECRILSVYEDGGYGVGYLVRPTGGANPHSRMIRQTAVLPD